MDFILRVLKKLRALSWFLMNTDTQERLISCFMFPQLSVCELRDRVREQVVTTVLGLWHQMDLASLLTSLDTPCKKLL